MQTFHDKTGQAWNLALTTTTAKRVNAEMRAKGYEDFHILRLDEGEPPALLALLRDDIQLTDLLWALLRPAAGQTAEQAHVSFEDFADVRLAGDGINAAADAFFEELISFFRPRRPQMAELIRLELELQTAAAEAALKHAAKINPKVLAENVILSALSMLSPASSEPTPDP